MQSSASGGSKRHRDEKVSWTDQPAAHSLAHGGGSTGASAQPFAGPPHLHWLPPQLVPPGGPPLGPSWLVALTRGSQTSQTSSQGDAPQSSQGGTPEGSTADGGTPEGGTPERCTPVAALSDSSAEVAEEEVAAEEREVDAGAAAETSRSDGGLATAEMASGVGDVAGGVPTEAEIAYDWVEGVLAQASAEGGNEVVVDLAGALPLLAAVTPPSPPCSPADDADRPELSHGGAATKRDGVPMLCSGWMTSLVVGGRLDGRLGGRPSSTDGALLSILLAWTCFHGRNAATFFLTSQASQVASQHAPPDGAAPRWQPEWRMDNQSESIRIHPVLDAPVRPVEPWAEAAELDFTIHLIEIFIGLGLCSLLLHERAVATIYATISLASQSSILLVTCLASPSALLRATAAAATANMIMWQWRVFAANGIVHALLPQAPRAKTRLLATHMGLRLAVGLVASLRIGELDRELTATRVCLLHNLTPLLMTYAATHAIVHAMSRGVRVR